MKVDCRIMIATDRSECARLAERRAAMLCQQFGNDRIDIISVRDRSMIEMLTSALRRSQSDTEALIKKQISEECEEVIRLYDSSYGLKSNLLVRFGRPAAEIVSEMLQRKTDLLVVGANGKSPKEKLVLGNLPSKLLQTSPKPVLIVRNEARRAYESIMIAVDFSEDSLYQAREALRLATPDTELVIVHAYEVPSEGMMRYANVSQELMHEFRSNVRLSAGAEMMEFLSRLKAQNRVTTVIQPGIPYEVIKEQVKTRKTDLLVMGKQGHSRFEDFILGSTSRNAIYETQCDIMVVPPGHKA